MTLSLDASVGRVVDEKFSVSRLADAQAARGAHIVNIICGAVGFVDVAEKYRPRSESLHILPGERHVRSGLHRIQLFHAPIEITVADQYPLFSVDRVFPLGDLLAHLRFFFIGDKQKRERIQLQDFRFCVDANVVPDNALLTDARIMIAGDDVHLNRGVIAAETFELRVFLEVLVEQIAGDNQGVDAGRNCLGKDVLEGVIPLGAFCPGPQVCISRYCYFHRDPHHPKWDRGIVTSLSALKFEMEISTSRI